MKTPPPPFRPTIANNSPVPPPIVLDDAPTQLLVIKPTPAIAYRPKKSRVKPYLWVAGVAIAVAAVAWYTGYRPGDIQEPAIRSAVRTYLSENLDDPNYTDVRWWKSVPLKEGVEVESRLEKDRKGIRLVRFKFRTPRPFGGMSLHDQIFAVRRGQVIANYSLDDRKAGPHNAIWWSQHSDE